MTPRIFQFAYDHQRPTGGQKSVYRHVDILNGAGFNATVLHMTKNFRLHWFANATKVVDAEELRSTFDANRDFLALPEDLGKNILTFPGRKLVINNQSVSYGFLCFGLDRPSTYPCLDPRVRAVIVKSDTSVRRLQFAYPGSRIHRVIAGISPEVYPFKPLTEKKKLIVAPRTKNPIDLGQVFHLANSRAAQGLNRLSGFDWVFIQDMTETEVSRLLQDALVLVFLSTYEGFGRLPLEAMRCGTTVAAYGVPPLTEYLTEKNSFISAPADVDGIVRSLETIVNLYEEGSPKLEEIRKAALESTVFYSPAAEEETVVAAWRRIISDNP